MEKIDTDYKQRIEKFWPKLFKPFNHDCAPLGPFHIFLRFLRAHQYGGAPLGRCQTIAVSHVCAFDETR